MLIDGRQIPEATVIEADLCIVGAGAAGITLAREFAGTAIKVCVIESGGLEFDEQAQALNRGEVVGLPLTEPDASRLRFFGGTTNHWAGVCRPLDADDFEVRPWIPYSGWPISRSDLDPYYRRAYGLVQLESDDFDPASWTDSMAEFFRLPFIGERLTPAIFHKSPPTRFGEIYRDDLANAANIYTYLFTNVVDVETNDAASVVTRLRVSCLDGNRFWFKAKTYILAASGIENPRLLLVANKVQSAGLGNGHDLVGRFYMNHPNLDAAWILLSEASSIANAPVTAAGMMSTNVVLSERTTAEEQIAKFSAELSSASNEETVEFEKGYSSLRALVRAVRHGEFPADFMTHLENVIADLGGTISGLSRKYGAGPLILVNAEYEQVPNPDSRITLGTNRDALGLQEVEVDWKFTSLDKYSLRRNLEIIGEAVGHAGLGRLKMREWVTSDDLSSFPGTDVWHHAGTTRMSADPQTGVVNEHCRVHGIENLYIAGSSVFPTEGYAAPTLTIVALALRLAEHIKTLTA